MNLLSGLHGVVAIVLLCSLLFVEEAGVPLPFAPGELTLLAAGLLIAAGGLDPWVFVPLAFGVCVAGAMVGYSWARIVGDHGLTGLAVRFHQAKALERVARRVQRASPVGIAVSRLIPGLRIYTTLVAGAFGVRRRTFLEGLLPSTAIWVGVFVALGIVVGIPVEHFLTKLAQMAVQGAILLVLGVGGYFAIRRAPAREREPLVNVPGWIKTSLAALVDLGVVASVLTGILAIARMVTGTGVIASWADGVVALAALAAAYLFITRRSSGATVGEALLHTVYVRRRAGGTVVGIAASSGPHDPSLQSAAEVLTALAAVPRLAVVRALLGGAATSAEVARDASMTSAETVFHLAALRKAGLVGVVSGTGREERFRITSQFRGWVGDFLGERSEQGPMGSTAGAQGAAGGA
ncbi:MAG TPA: VTT domain-containing protein [Candidatus Dormibacteraeota bacterium]|nr:VTT domain-containing protein [Candidatus Dormibacteraeota bacterium]